MHLSQETMVNLTSNFNDLSNKNIISFHELPQVDICSWKETLFLKLQTYSYRLVLFIHKIDFP